MYHVKDILTNRADVSSSVPRIRSQLYVPGDRADWMRKALASGVDCVLVDLEDAVADAEKPRARAITAEFLRTDGADAICMVRVSPADTPAFYADARAVVEAGVHGLALPKVTGPDDIVVADRVLGWLEAEFGRPPGSVRLSPIFETAQSVWAAREIAAASPRVAYCGGVSAPGGDIERAVGFRWSAGGAETATMRALVLLGLRAAGVPNPIAGTWTDVADLDGLRAFAEQSRDLGYEGFVVIHPSHVAVVNEVFSPTPEEVEYHAGLLEALDAAIAEGRGAVSYRGRMIDLAMRGVAERIVALGGGAMVRRGGHRGPGGRDQATGGR
jgi:citrate lyase subunit beta/citryl-CoA lyase